MTLITGTFGNDRLVGTAGDDTLVSLSGTDILLGRAGADIYQLDFQSMPLSPRRHFTINETNGGDTSVDTVTGLGNLMLYHYGGVQDFTSFTRVGTDGNHLIIETASSPSRYNHVGYTAGDIRITNQYNDTAPNAQIEILVAGGISYNLVHTNIGTVGADIMTGWSLADTLMGGDGNDYISGGGRRDTLHGEAGNDTIFGDAGNDLIYGGGGVDQIFGGAHNDRIWGGEGSDIIEGGTGRDTLRGENGDDRLLGGAGDDRLVGGNGTDILDGGAGDDTLIGGASRDIYSVTTTEVQHDTIIENGRAPSPTLPGASNHNRDVIEILGYASYEEASHNIGFEISGDDLIITYTHPTMAAVQSSSITIVGQFASAAQDIELISFGEAGGTAGYIGTAAHHIAMLSGDDFTYSIHANGDSGGEDIVLGTAGDDEIYGGIGDDILSGLGGADVFMFHDEDGNDAGHDIILDFDIADDLIDVTEIAGLTYADMTVSENAWGNAVISSAYFEIELAGISATDISADTFIIG